MNEWSNQWVECPVCGETNGNRTGCERCARRAAEADGHVGYYNLTEGWTCYGSCPACRGEELE